MPNKLKILLRYACIWGKSVGSFYCWKDGIM